MRLIIIFLIIFSSLRGFNQENQYKLPQDIKLQNYEDVIKHDSAEYTIITTVVKNNSADTFLLWFLDNDNNQPVDKIIKDHFFKRKGDFTLFQPATETLSSDSKLEFSIFSFSTYLLPASGKFKNQIIYKEKITDSISAKCISLINKQMVIISLKDLAKYFELKTIDPILNKTGKTIIDWNLIKDGIID